MTSPLARQAPEWPAPVPKRLPSVLALLRALVTRDHNLLALLPASAYEVDIGPLGYSRRQIVLVNAPALVKQVLTDGAAHYPKSDLMVEALDPLVGQSIFTSSGEQWQQQRRMIDPAFTHMRVTSAYASMRAAVDTMQDSLDEATISGAPLSLDLTMSQLTADVICRTVFSTALATDTAREVFDAFTIFERSVAQVRLHRLILAPAFTPVKQEAEVVAACQRIRHHLGLLLDTHLRDQPFDDIATQVMQARDGGDGAGFSREALIDQLGVMFLAGHETTASALTWAFTLIAMRPDVMASMRAEIAQVVGEGPIEYEHIKALSRVRNVFREALRLYPPLTFMPRVATQAGKLGDMTLKRGALVMIAPWTIHRHRRYWRDPDRFDPERFSPEREHELTPGAYLPFGFGPRVCIGAAFALTEATLILAQLVRRYDLEVLAPEAVHPAARLTTRPRHQVMVRLKRRVKQRLNAAH